MNVLQTQLVSMLDQICEIGIGRIPGFKNGRQKSEECNTGSVQISRWAMGNPAIGALVARVQPKHEKHANQQMTTREPENWPGRSPLLRATPQKGPDFCG